MANKNEHTYIMIRHNGVQRGLVGEIIKRFEQKGYRLTAMKMQNSTKEKAEDHYKDLKALPFFPGLNLFFLKSFVFKNVFISFH